MKLRSISKSTRDGKKWMAIFEKEDDRTKTVHFGASGYDDYTIMTDREKAEKKRSSYIRRHSKEDWSKPDTAASLSRWILWEHKSFRKAVQEYRKKFKL